VEFDLYSYENEEDFKEDIYTKDDRPYWCINYSQPISYEGKELVLSMNTNFLLDTDNEEDWDYYRTKYVQLPQTLPEGHYIAVIKYQDMERKAYIQVNAMAAYVGSADNKTIAMVYESESAAPVGGVQVIFDNFTIVTGQDGLAVSETPLFTEEGYTCWA
jgi:hypothetical protein